MIPVDVTLRNKPQLNAIYTNKWPTLVDFRLCDAAQPDQKYVDDEGKDISHIYSYNKVMSEEDRAGIAEILNRTNYKVLAWYFGPTDTERSGLRDFKLLGRMSMPSTGSEKFTVYVYFKTVKYSNDIEQCWEEHDNQEEEDDDADDEANNRASPVLGRSSKSPQSIVV